MEILEMVLATWELEPGDRIIVSGGPVEVKSINDLVESINLVFYSHESGEYEEEDFGPDDEFPVWIP